MKVFTDPNVAAGWLAAGELLYQLLFVFAPTVLWLCRWWSSHSFSSKEDRRLWFSQHSWYVVFVTINAVIFWASMSAALKQPMWDTLLNNQLVTAQMTFMVLAASLVSQSGDVKDIGKHPTDWRKSLSFAILMNLFALWHSVKYSSTSFELVLWLAMNCLTLSFYAVVLIGSWRPTTIVPPKLLFLWKWVVLPLTILVIVDLMR